MKDLDIGEAWSNYSYSYVNVGLGEYHRAEFTMWASNYLLKESNKDDVEPNDEDLDSLYASKNLFRGIVKYYAWKIRLGN